MRQGMRLRLPEVWRLAQELRDHGFLSWCMRVRCRRGALCRDREEGERRTLRHELQPLGRQYPWPLVWTHVFVVRLVGGPDLRFRFVLALYSRKAILDCFSCQILHFGDKIEKARVCGLGQVTVSVSYRFDATRLRERFFFFDLDFARAGAISTRVEIIWPAMFRGICHPSRMSASASSTLLL